MNSIDALLLFINQNWASIVTCVLLVIGIVAKIKNWMKQSDEEKLESTKKIIRETILSHCSEAEESYREWTKAGSIKRSKVIEELYLLYPILETAIDKEELIAFLDDCINEALVELRRVIETNESSFVITVKEDN